MYEVGQPEFLDIGDQFIPNSSLRESAAIIDQFDLTILSDGGLHNICNAVNAPVLLFQAYQNNAADLFVMKNAHYRQEYHTECRHKCDIFSKISGCDDEQNKCDKQCYQLDAKALADHCIEILTSKK